MCGRYTYYCSKEIIKEFDLLLKPEVQLALTLPDNYNVSPGDHMPVIIRGKQEHELIVMVWGLLPAWSKSEHAALKLINARKEGLFEKPMWKRLVKSRRCIVPARGFYEWKKTEQGKQPYYITPSNVKIFSFAGLWDEWTDPTGSKIRSYTIITTTPNSVMANVHNRMPAILNKEQADIWLSPLELDQHQIDDVLKPAPDNSIQLVRVSSDVNNARNNSEALLYPLED